MQLMKFSCVVKQLVAARSTAEVWKTFPSKHILLQEPNTAQQHPQGGTASLVQTHWQHKTASLSITAGKKK